MRFGRIVWSARVWIGVELARGGDRGVGGRGRVEPAGKSRGYPGTPGVAISEKKDLSVCIRDDVRYTDSKLIALRFEMIVQQSLEANLPFVIRP